MCARFSYARASCGVVIPHCALSHPAALAGAATSDRRMTIGFSMGWTTFRRGEEARTPPRRDVVLRSVLDQFSEKMAFATQSVSLGHSFLLLVYRDLRLAMRQGGDAAMVVAFFVLTVILFP